MKKQKMFGIMAGTNSEMIKELAEKITQAHAVTIIKKPSKTLTMIKMREPVKNSLYYLGEVMVTEAVVEINGIKGMAVTMGDDFEKVLNMAIIDSGFNAKLPQTQEIANKLEAMHEKQLERKEKENAMHLKTMVNFSSMTAENMS